MFPVIGFLCENCGFLLGGRVVEPLVSTFAMIWDAMISGEVLVKCPHCGHENLLKEMVADGMDVN